MPGVARTITGENGSVMNKTLQIGGTIGIAALLGIARAGGAMAMPTCEGTYAAELLRPMPARIVVDLDVHDRSTDHLRLAERFLDGLRVAGVAVGPQPTVLLSISSSRIESFSDRPADTAMQTYPEFSGLQGGLQPSLPVMPNTRMVTPEPAPSAPLLIFRVEATEGHASQVSWVVTVRCQTIGTDDGARAEDLGRVIGGALGKRVNLTPF